MSIQQLPQRTIPLFPLINPLLKFPKHPLPHTHPNEERLNYPFNFIQLSFIRC